MAVRTGSDARGGFMRRLYRGETNFDLVGRRKRWYLVSAIIILICLASIVFRGFNFGIDFAGGNQYLVPAQSGIALSVVRAAAEGTGADVASAQTAGSGAAKSYVIRTSKLSNQAADNAQINAVRAALAKAAQVPLSKVSNNEVSSSWGSEVTRQALIALVVFLIAVSAFMWLRFKEIKVAGAAVLALIHDLVLTAGVYSLSGFEVTPGTVVGLLTILGYSLYDTVVVFDKVDENTRGLLGTSRMTYGESANLAVNQTLMRSINTSLIGLLPVAGLLFVGAGLLGVGTLEDLALVLFVGMITGAYSSLFLATPWLVDFKMLDPRYRNHAKRVLTKRASEAGKSRQVPAKAAKTVAGKRRVVEDDDIIDADLVDDDESQDALAGAAPRVGSRPAKSSGTRATPAKRTGASRSRPSGGKRRH